MPTKRIRFSAPVVCVLLCCLAHLGCKQVDFCGRSWSLEETEVFCFDHSVIELSALKTMTRLKYLYLKGTQISDLSALKGLSQLERLCVFGTQVKDLSPLAGLTKLRFLDFANTQVEDITVLQKLNNLGEVYLGKTRVPASQINMLKKSHPGLKVGFFREE